MLQIKTYYEAIGKKGPVLDCSDLPSMCQDHFAEGSDINRIVERFDRTGVLSTGVQGTHVAKYGDFSKIGDYQSAVNMVNQSMERFMELPAKVRKYFRNDPSLFIQFMDNIEDPQYKAKAADLGLIVEKEEKETTLEDVVKAVNGLKKEPVEPASAQR